MAYFTGGKRNFYSNSATASTTAADLVSNVTASILELDIEDDDFPRTMDIEYKLLTTVIWSLLVFTGVLGNGFVIFTIIKSRKFNNVIQCYLLNLAITDFLFVVLCIPITTLTYMQDHWVLGRILCKLFHFAAFTTVSATCLTLTMMTIDRYMFICNVNFKKRTSRCVFHISLMIWLISICLGSPYLVYSDVIAVKNEFKLNATLNEPTEIILECRTTSDSTVLWNHISGWYATFANYIIPSVVINICYIRIMIYVSTHTANVGIGSHHNHEIVVHKKRKVGRTIILFTSVFIILWFPIHALSIWYRLDKNFPTHSVTFAFKLIAHTMSYTNPTINPVIYAFSNDLFKLSLSNVFPCLFKPASHNESPNTRILRTFKNLAESEALVDAVGNNVAAPK